MKKITTLFKKDPKNLKLVTSEIGPENEWALDPAVSVATVKLDGTACAIIRGRLYKRYDAKNGKPVPSDAIPCQEPDATTGHWPHWVPCKREDPADKWHFDALDRFEGSWNEGTYELCGPKINGNPEEMSNHSLIPHGFLRCSALSDFSFEGIKDFLSDPIWNIEGIVFHHKTDGRMCKIRKSDFGIKRQQK